MRNTEFSVKLQITRHFCGSKVSLTPFLQTFCCVAKNRCFSKADIFPSKECKKAAAHFSNVSMMYDMAPTIAYSNTDSCHLFQYRYPFFSFLFFFGGGGHTTANAAKIKNIHTPLFQWNSDFSSLAQLI